MRNEDIISVLNSLDVIQPGFLERASETKDILEFTIRNESLGKEIVSMKFLRYSVAAYVLAYYEASILYSSLSVELMLLRSAIRLWGEDKLAEMKHKIAFRWLVHGAGVLKSKADVDIAENLRLMRNCYVHFQNQILTSSLEPIQAKGVPGLSAKEVQKINSFIQTFHTTVDTIYRGSKKLVSRECRDFIEKRRSKMEATLVSDLQGVSVGFPELLRRAYKVQSQDALDAIRWSKQLLDKRYL